LTATQLALGERVGRSGGLSKSASVASAQAGTASPQLTLTAMSSKAQDSISLTVAVQLVP
jgi:hypothetical protein